MKYYKFYRESNKFDDILKDNVIKKLIYTKIRWRGHLLLGLTDPDDKIASYITLKYGDEMKNHLVTDRTPVPFVDYQPKQPRWFK